MTDLSALQDATTIRSQPRFPLQPYEARRLLRFELERLVLEADMRHGTIAGWLGVSRPSASASLACANLLSKPGLEVLCARLDRLVWLPRLNSLLTAARRKTPEPGSPGANRPRDAELVIGLEAFADGMTVFDPWLVPLQLQTQMYAAALTKLDDIASNTTRERRQAPLLDDREPLGFCWITSEHALHRRAGGPAVMHDQLAHLTALAARPNVTIQVIPARVELPPTSPFQLIEGRPSVVVEPSRLAMHVAYDAGTPSHFRRLLDGLVQRALSPEASATYIAGLRP